MRTDLPIVRQFSGDEPDSDVCVVQSLDIASPVQPIRPMLLYLLRGQTGAHIRIYVWTNLPLFSVFRLLGVSCRRTVMGMVMNVAPYPETSAELKSMITDVLSIDEPNDYVDDALYESITEAYHSRPNRGLNGTTTVNQAVGYHLFPHLGTDMDEPTLYRKAVFLAFCVRKLCMVRIGLLPYDDPRHQGRLRLCGDQIARSIHTSMQSHIRNFKGSLRRSPFIDSVSLDTAKSEWSTGWVTRNITTKIFRNSRKKPISRKIKNKQQDHLSRTISELRSARRIRIGGTEPSLDTIVTDLCCTSKEPTGKDGSVLILVDGKDIGI